MIARFNPATSALFAALVLFLGAPTFAGAVVDVSDITDIITELTAAAVTLGLAFLVFKYTKKAYNRL